MGAVGQIQLSQVNIRHRPSIAEALKGADAVVNLVGVLFQDGANGFAAVQSAGAASIAQLSAEAGIKNLVHLSAIGADAEGSSIYARTKGEGEKAVLDAGSVRDDPAPINRLWAGGRVLQSLCDDGDVDASYTVAAYRRGKTQFQPFMWMMWRMPCALRLSNRMRKDAFLSLAGQVSIHSVS